jgi:hypothetical protein
MSYIHIKHAKIKFHEMNITNDLFIYYSISNRLFNILVHKD